MRINKFVAQTSGLSRRAADQAIAEGRVRLNDQLARPGDDVTDQIVRLDGRVLRLPTSYQTIMLNKPIGYVCSRQGQGSQTIYDLLPPEYHHLKPVGRLDKDSSGLLLLTSDGDLANQLTHPRYTKVKIYEVELDKPLQPEHRDQIIEGVQLEDGLSRLGLKTSQTDTFRPIVTMHEGRNRQIRRTFAALGYNVSKLHRVAFGPYQLDGLATSHWRTVDNSL